MSKKVRDRFKLNKKIESIMKKSKKVNKKYQNPDGTFKVQRCPDGGKENKFCGCVNYQMVVGGYSQERAEKICGKIKQQKGGSLKGGASLTKKYDTFESKVSDKFVAEMKKKADDYYESDTGEVYAIAKEIAEDLRGDIEIGNIEDEDTLATWLSEKVDDHLNVSGGCHNIVRGWNGDTSYLDTLGAEGYDAIACAYAYQILIEEAYGELEEDIEKMREGDAEEMLEDIGEQEEIEGSKKKSDYGSGLNLSPDEEEFMDYLDEFYPDVPGGYGLLLYKGDPIAFQVGLEEWLSEKEYEKEQEGDLNKELEGDWDELEGSKKVSNISEESLHGVKESVDRAGNMVMLIKHSLMSGTTGEVGEQDLWNLITSTEKELEELEGVMSMIADQVSLLVGSKNLEFEKVTEGNKKVKSRNVDRRRGKPLTDKERLERHKSLYPEDEVGKVEELPERGTGLSDRTNRGREKPLTDAERLERHKRVHPEDKVEKVEELPDRGSGLENMSGKSWEIKREKGASVREHYRKIGEIEEYEERKGKSLTQEEAESLYNKLGK